MTLRADEGKILEVKEPIVLDSNGEPISSPVQEDSSFSNSYSYAGGKVRIFKLPGLLAPLGLLAVAALIVLVVVFTGAALGVLAIAAAILFFLRMLFPQRR